MMIGKEVLIVDGAHQFENGRVMREDLRTYTLPFVEVHMRTKAGAFRKNCIAFVPMKYCVEFDVSELEERELEKCRAKYGEESDAYRRVVSLLEKSKGVEQPA
jgi:hypothetical protein